MAKRSYGESRKAELAGATSWGLQDWLRGPFLAAIFSFVPSFVVAGLSALVGARGGARHRTQGLIEEPAAIHPSLKFNPPKEPSVVQGLYLGQAMDLESYKGMKDELVSETGRPSEEDMKAFRERVFGRMQGVFLSDEVLTRHVFVGGSTGLGKSVFYKSLAFQQIQRGGGLLIFDAKGANELGAEIAMVAKACDRSGDFMWFNLDASLDSHTYNPLRRRNVRELVSAVMKLYGEVSASNEFFGKMARNALQAGLICMFAQVPAKEICLSDLAVLFASPRVFMSLYKKMPDQTLEQQQDKDFVFQFLNQYISPRKERNGEMSFELNDRKFSEALRGLIGSLLDFSHSEWMRVANSYNPDIEIFDAITNNKIILITLPALADKESAKLFGRLFIADLSRAVGELFKRNQRSLIPYLVLLDEYGSIADFSHVELWQQARGANIALFAAVQGRGFLDQVDKSFTNNLITNCWTHMYFSMQDADSQRLAMDLAGSTINHYRSESVSTSFGKNFDNSRTGFLNKESHSRGESYGLSEKSESLLQPQDFQLGMGEALMVGKFGVYINYLPNVKFTGRVPMGDEVQLPKFNRPERDGFQLMRASRLTEEYRLHSIADSTDLQLPEPPKPDKNDTFTADDSEDSGGGLPRPRLVIADDDPSGAA